MITFKRTSLEDFVKSYSPKTPSNDDINAFEGHIQAFFSKALGSSGEEYQKNEINSFLKNIFDYDCNTKDRIDSAIYADGIAQVLIEVKALGKSGFPKSPDNPISTALSESILYFLREFRASNNSIKHIILCTPCEFFIFDAKSFLIFERDKHIKELHNNCDAKKGTDTTTKKFYSDLENHLNGDFEGTLPFTYFNLQEAIKDKNRKNLSFIYQLLSPQVLLKQQKTIDANTLNKKFYDELLYILGLKEKKDSNSKITRIVPSGVSGTMSDAITTAFDTITWEDTFALITTWNNRVLFLRLLESLLVSFNHISEAERFLGVKKDGDLKIKSFSTLNSLFFQVLAKRPEDRGNAEEIKPFSKIPYLNSSLFDKTPLERDGKLIASIASNEVKIFQNSVLKSDKDYKNQTTLPLLEYYLAFLQAYDFTTTPKDIQDNVKTNHDTLINSAVLGLVFEKLNGYKEGSFYTPSFITSYMCEDAITRAVLEKYNSSYGWDCQTLEELRENMDRNFQQQKESYRKTFFSIRICDPAVGSGHFLVSALNQMILIAYKLGLIPLRPLLELENDEIVIYIDKDKNEIFQYTQPIHADDDYHKIQQSLFNLKKSIIENCLFGVDINPNSCEITKLRLWIELLKHSYYISTKEGQITNELQTLPNIDINIKCGNSLLSYFDLGQDFRHIPNIKERISRYKKVVQNYKEGDFVSKSQIDREIKDLLEAFKKICLPKKFEKELEALRKLCQRYTQNYGDYLAGEDKELKKYVSKNFGFDFAIDEAKAQEDFQALRQAYKKIFSLEEHNPFEWRFAFPEVLDDEGDFMGFDCVIGNPPYIRQESIKEQKSNLQKNYQVHEGKADIYVYFYERGHQILRDGGLLSYITSNKYTRAGYGKNLRTFLLKNTQILSYIDFNGVKVFDSASVDTSILTFAKTSPQEDYAIDYLACQEKQIPKNPDFLSIPSSALSGDSFTFALEHELPLLEKIKSAGTPLKEWGDNVIGYGIKTSRNNIFIITTQKREEILANCKDEDERQRTSQIIKKILRGRDIQRYGYAWAEKWLINTHNGYTSQQGERIPPINIEDYPALKAYLDSFPLELIDKGDRGITYYNLRNCAYVEDFEKEKIIWAEMTKEPRFIYDNFGFHTIQTCYTLISPYSKYLLGVLNSKISLYFMQQISATLGSASFRWIRQYVENIPIPKIDSTNQSIADKIIALVEEILALKAENPQSTTIKPESQINKLVYTLYNLTNEEIELIEKG